jgi:hypothetical protein
MFGSAPSQLPGRSHLVQLSSLLAKPGSCFRKTACSAVVQAAGRRGDGQTAQLARRFLQTLQAPSSPYALSNQPRIHTDETQMVDKLTGLVLRRSPTAGW